MSDFEDTLELEDEGDEEEGGGGSSASFHLHIHGAEGGEKERDNDAAGLLTDMSLYSPPPPSSSVKEKTFNIENPEEAQLNDQKSGPAVGSQSLSGILWAQSYDPPNFNSVLSETYEHGQLMLSSLLAKDFASISFDVFNEMVRQREKIKKMRCDLSEF